MIAAGAGFGADGALHNAASRPRAIPTMLCQPRRRMIGGVVGFMIGRIELECGAEFIKNLR